MATQKTYFVLPGVFEAFRDDFDTPLTDRLQVVISSYKVAGIEQLQNLPQPSGVTAGILQYDQAELSECNQDMSTCAIGGIDDSFNLFYNFALVDFPIVNGVARGVTTGTTTGVDYGINPLNITVDKNEILDGFGVARKGSFAVDIDYDQDFYLRIRILANPTASSKWLYDDGVTFEIQHTASICSSTFTSEKSGTNQVVDIYSYGFLKGIDVGTEAKDYHILPSCYDLTPVDVCEGYCGYSIGIIARKPKADSPQIIKKTCCDELKVFAELTSKTDEFKNDFKSLIYKRQVSTDTYTFKLVRCSDNTEYVLDAVSPYGVFYDFGDFEEYPDYTGFRLEWYEVINGLGVGKYKLITEYNILGNTGTFESCLYNLRVFSFDEAIYTVRFDSTLNSYYEQQDIDLTGLFWEDSVRVPGTFGRRQINTEIDELVYRGREVQDVKTEYLNEYSFQSELISRCAFPNLADWILRGDRIKVSDFNPYAADDYKDFEVKVNDISEIKYFERNDKRIFECTFGQRILNNRKL